MNINWKISLAVVAGAIIGAVGIDMARAAAKPPGYLVVEYEITDPAGFKTYLPRQLLYDPNAHQISQAPASHDHFIMSRKGKNIDTSSQTCPSHRHDPITCRQNDKISTRSIDMSLPTP